MQFLKATYTVVFLIVCAVLVLPTIVNEINAAFGSTVNQAQTVTVGSTTTTSLSQRQQIANQAFKIVSTTGTSLQCQFYNVTFMGNEGQYVSGNFTSIIPLNFYLVPDQTYRNWLTTGDCGNSADAIASQLNTMAYGFNATFTSTGPWDIILVNSSSRDADGYLVAYLSSTGYTVTQPILATTTQGLTIASTNPSIPGFPAESIALGTLIGVAVLMVLRYRRRSH